MVNLATLVGDWEYSQDTHLVSPALSQVAEPNPRRYAIGFGVTIPVGGSFPSNDDRVALTTIQDVLHGFIQLGNFSFKWFDLPKHGVLVTQPFFAILDSMHAGFGNLLVIEIVQSAK